jgi:histidine ammonia-lyase
MKMASHSEPIYGINTGFGSLCNVKISNENLSKLQENLVKSHSCGTGEKVPLEIVKLMLLLKIQSLWIFWCSNPNSRALNRFYNNDILPVCLYTRFLRTSGDLAPLAHCLCLYLEKFILKEKSRLECCHETF